MAERAGDVATKKRLHEHEFHALHWHFGQYGRQDVHMHPCDCGTELVGEGRECGGPKTKHVAKKLTSRTTWGERKNEGKPL